SSGKLLAYNQLVKHDFHDWDVDRPSPLVKTRAGREIAASANKDGLLSVVDRSRVRAGAMLLLYQTQTTTRANVETSLSRDTKTRFCPGYLGASECNSAACHPSINTLYVDAVFCL